jgi:uncharacterized protein (DUF302 family)
MKIIFTLILASLCLNSAAAEQPNVLSWTIDKDLESSYTTLYSHLEDNKFYVVFEPDIQSNLQHFAERWGEDYNRNKLQGIRAMVFCNGWYANQISNQDPSLLALCPLHITLIQEMGHTRVLFARPTVIAHDSKALSLVKELEEAVSKAVQGAVNELGDCPATC